MIIQGKAPAKPVVPTFYVLTEEHLQNKGFCHPTIRKQAQWGHFRSCRQCSTRTVHCNTHLLSDRGFQISVGLKEGKGPKANWRYSTWSTVTWYRWNIWSWNRKWLCARTVLMSQGGGHSTVRPKFPVLGSRFTVCQLHPELHFYYFSEFHETQCSLLVGYFLSM
jgi:hypothetical protein